MKSRIFIAAAALLIGLTGCTNEQDITNQRESLASQPTSMERVTPPNETKATPHVPEVPEASQPNNTTTIHTASSDRLSQAITLYELAPKLLDKKTTEIPSYHKGDITFWTEEQVNSFNEGHSVPWGDPLVRTFLGISNLIPYEYLMDETIGEQMDKGGGYDHVRTLRTQNNIVFTSQPYDDATRTTVVDVNVPDLGTYNVTLKTGTDSRIQNIMKIVFNPDPTSNIQTRFNDPRSG
ncbi:hypothetical protein ACFFSY_03165 [Paenibacillus aurantiacus]|uniref:DUF4309 domain-containing protein n=1 Tax=Paenibacillus aurantiacus TaxID=1936118 RepID=A0ABV5KK06_9BACL